MHIGYEIEGRYKGLKTLFVSMDDMWKIGYINEINEITSKEDINHIYLGADRSRLHGFNTPYGWIGRWIKEGKKITLELFLGDNTAILESMNALHKETFEKVHFIITMPDNPLYEIMRKMKDTDTIKLQEKDHGRLWCFQLGKADSITDFPEDYIEDKKVNAND